MATHLAIKTEEATNKSVKWSTVNSKRFLQNCLRMVQTLLAYKKKKQMVMELLFQAQHLVRRIASKL